MALLSTLSLHYQAPSHECFQCTQSSHRYRTLLIGRLVWLLTQATLVNKLKIDFLFIQIGSILCFFMLCANEHSTKGFVFCFLFTFTHTDFSNEFLKILSAKAALIKLLLKQVDPFCFSPTLTKVPLLFVCLCTHFGFCFARSAQQNWHCVHHTYSQSIISTVEHKAVQSCCCSTCSLYCVFEYWIKMVVQESMVLLKMFRWVAAWVGMSACHHHDWYALLQLANGLSIECYTVKATAEILRPTTKMKSFSRLWWPCKPSAIYSHCLSAS